MDAAPNRSAHQAPEQHSFPASRRSMMKNDS